jgi:hypothetical protein
MSVSFRDNRSQYDEILKEVELLNGSFVLVGFQEGVVTKAQSKGGRRKEAGKSMAQIAAENEFGTDRIPARPFMTTSFDENRARINRAIQGEYAKILDGTSTVRRSLNLIGQFMTGLIQKKIRDIHYPPNSPRTIAAKGSSKPLIDFGQMVQSVRHKVVLS